MRKRKVIIIGVKQAGKTSILNALCKTGTFSPDYLPTDGIETRVLHLMRDREYTKLHLVDFAGDEKYTELLPNYFNNVNIVLLVFSYKQDFALQEKYLSRLLESIFAANKKFRISVLITQCDDTPQRIFAEEIEQFITILKNKTGTNVESLWISATNPVHIQELHRKLDTIVHAENIDPEEMRKMKDNMRRIFKSYISFYKVSFFGHRHNDRALAILAAIENARTLSEITLILESQVTIFNSRNHTTEMQELFVDVNLDARWTTKLINQPVLPDESGYYQIILRAKNFIETANPQSEFSLRHQRYTSYA